MHTPSRVLQMHLCPKSTRATDRKRRKRGGGEGGGIAWGARRKRRVKWGANIRGCGAFVHLAWKLWQQEVELMCFPRHGGRGEGGSRPFDWNGPFFSAIKPGSSLPWNKEGNASFQAWLPFSFYFPLLRSIGLPTRRFFIPLKPWKHKFTCQTFVHLWIQQNNTEPPLALRNETRSASGWGPICPLGVSLDCYSRRRTLVQRWPTKTKRERGEKLPPTRSISWLICGSPVSWNFAKQLRVQHKINSAKVLVWFKVSLKDKMLNRWCSWRVLTWRKLSKLLNPATCKTFVGC